MSAPGPPRHQSLAALWTRCGLDDSDQQPEEGDLVVTGGSQRAAKVLRLVYWLCACPEDEGLPSPALASPYRAYYEAEVYRYSNDESGAAAHADELAIRSTAREVLRDMWEAAPVPSDL